MPEASTPSPASHAPLCPSASAVPAEDTGVEWTHIIPADTSPSVRPENPIALTLAVPTLAVPTLAFPTLAVPTSSHSGTHASSLQVWCWSCLEPHDMSTCPEAAADRLDFEASLLTIRPSRTDEQLNRDREEQANRWRRACTEHKAYVRLVPIEAEP